MNFQRKHIVKRKYTKTPLTTNKKAKEKKDKKLIIKTISQIVIGFSVIFLLLTLFIYKKYLENLPPVTELEHLDIFEASTIYDREGEELYKIYKEKRTYIPYEEINENMIHAIVAWEDQSFFTNKWVDFYRMTWAIVYYIMGKTDRIKGTSTISQQLIRNTIITNEDSLERKIKEIYLSYKMTEELSKEKILELYLNKIFYWSNAYGIEQAAQTFFGTGATNINILQASILASLPKWPSYYSPYNHSDRLLWYIYNYNPETPSETNNIITNQDIINNKDQVDAIIETFNNFEFQKISDDNLRICWLEKSNYKKTISVDQNGCLITTYSNLLSLLNAIKIPYGEQVIEYQTGRKDFILGRMLEDEYITFEDYKEALINGIGYEFKAYLEKIKYPYFVLYVKEYVEKKYGTDILESGWLQIFTTLDSDLQDKAEELIELQTAKNLEKFDAQNAALISLDNKTGDILAMVWGRDYFDTDNRWNVNMITSPIQPWSSFKPFVYALAIDTKEIGTKTPIYDVQTTFPWYSTPPKNYDGTFMGKMNLTTALDYSRNIPALKMFSVAWWETAIVNLMKNLWVTTLREDGMYGAPLALGTWEISPLELAQAYSVFANLGKKKEVSPIMKIVDSNGLVIEERQEKDFEWEEVFSPASSYIITHMLSDTSSRPESRNSYLSLSDRPVAAKTGTSTKNFDKNGQKIVMPRNLWTAWYTPQITTVVWAWNTDWKETNYLGNGLEGAWPIWKKFMEYAHEGKAVETWKQAKWVETVNISTISWKLAPNNFDPKFVVSSLFKNPPKQYDESLKVVQVDALCNGKVDENTPKAAIKNVFLVSFHSLNPENAYWEEWVRAWINAWGWAELIGRSDFVTSVVEESCPRNTNAGNITVRANIEDGQTFVNGANYIEIAYRWDNPIIRLDIYAGENKISSLPIENKKEWWYFGNFSIPSWYYGEYELRIEAVDSSYYSWEYTYKVNIVQDDKTPPTITITNPEDDSITLYQDQMFNLRGKVEDISPIKSINIYLDGTPLKIGLQDREFSYPVNENYDLQVGTYTIKIEAVDHRYNKSTKDIKLEIIKR